jgi:ABC-type bacteriocin/lantibiotic exporter with double-glycine peptidase domain
LKKFQNVKKKIYREKLEISEMKEIILKNINFSYSEKSKLLKNVNISIKKGDKIAIRGSSGSGKTTLINLICGLLKPSSGNLIINGVNYEKKQYIFKKIIGFVPQENYLIDDTIKNNIIFFKNDKSFNNKKFKKVLKISNTNEFINKLPANIQTSVGERGLRFSGGQRQRIALARALYDEPQILILDEPTSFQDKKNNDTIIKNITNLKNLTLIFISHGSYNSKLFNKIYEIKNRTVKLKRNKN